MLTKAVSVLVATLALGSVAHARILPPLGALLDQARFTNDEVHTTASWSYSDCGLPTDAVQIHTIQVSPDPPQIGKDLTVTAKGYVARKIQDGAYADVTVKLGLIKLLHQQFDVCEEARKNNVTVQCPVEPGEYEVVHTVLLPKETPKGKSLCDYQWPLKQTLSPTAKFVVDVKGFVKEESEDPDMVCLRLTVDFISRPWLSI